MCMPFSKLIEKYKKIYPIDVLASSSALSATNRYQIIVKNVYMGFKLSLTQQNSNIKDNSKSFPYVHCVYATIPV